MARLQEDQENLVKNRFEVIQHQADKAKEEHTENRFTELTKNDFSQFAINRSRIAATLYGKILNEYRVGSDLLANISDYAPQMGVAVLQNTIHYMSTTDWNDDGEGRARFKARIEDNGVFQDVPGQSRISSNWVRLKYSCYMKKKTNRK